MIKIFWALPPLHFYCQWDTGRNFFLIWDFSSSCQHWIWVNLAKTYSLHFHRTDFSCASKPQLKIQCLSSWESKRVFSNIRSVQQRGRGGLKLCSSSLQTSVLIACSDGSCFPLGITYGWGRTQTRFLPIKPAQKVQETVFLKRCPAWVQG